MRSMRIVLRWLLFLGCVTAIGVGVFHFVRSSPRCVIEGPFGKYMLSPDGSRLVTFASGGGPPGRPRAANLGPLQVWDTHSGELLSQRWDAASIQCFFLGNDRVILQPLGGRTSILNWRTGDEWVTDIDERWDSIRIYGDGRYFFAWHETIDKTVVVDTLKRKVLPNSDGWANISENLRTMIVRGRDSDEIVVHDLAAEKVRGVLKLASKAPFLQMCPRGRWLLELDPAPQADGTPRVCYNISLWDLEKLERTFHLKSPEWGDLFPHFSGDGQYMTLHELGEVRHADLYVIDTAAGGVSWKHPVFNAGQCNFAPDNSTLAVSHGDGAGRQLLTVFDVATGRVLWERKDVIPWFVDSSCLLLLPVVQPPWAEFVDAFTGAPRGPALGDMILHLDRQSVTQTADRRHLLLHGMRWRNEERVRFPQWLEEWLSRIFRNNEARAVVLEAATLREKFRTSSPTDAFLISEDASTLAAIELTDTATIIRIHDVDADPASAWGWAVGISLGSALAWLGVVRLWRWRKKAKASRAA